MRWTLLTSLAAAGAATEAEVDAERERDNTSTGRERGRAGPRPVPTAEAKAAAWRARSRRPACPTRCSSRSATASAGPTDLTLLEPYVEKYHAMLDTASGSKGTHAIVEILIVQQFYPAALASQELLDATQAWLDANLRARGPALRLVSENRDSIARARPRATAGCAAMRRPDRRRRWHSRRAPGSA